MTVIKPRANYLLNNSSCYGVLDPIASQDLNHLIAPQDAMRWNEMKGRTKMNSVIEFTPEQTAELKAIWEAQKGELNPHDFTFIKVKLGRTKAKLTKNQTYRMTMTLAESGYEPIPEWLLSILDPK